MKITDMDLQDLSKLQIRDIDIGVWHRLSFEEFGHIARTLGALWVYNYEAAKRGDVGMHAELKSGLHSNMFFVSRILLEYESILQIMAAQVAMRIRWGLSTIATGMPDYIVGVPNGATKLGEKIGKILGIPTIQMAKVEGRIVLETPIEAGKSVLLVEDFCTRGTGFIEAVQVVLRAQPYARIIPLDPVMLNRGGLESIFIEGLGMVTIVSVVEWQAWDCDPTVHCELCDMGSIPIEPKQTEETWRLLTTSQL